MLDGIGAEPNFERKQQREQEFVVFIQTPAAVLEHSKREVLNDVVDALAWNG